MDEYVKREEIIKIVSKAYQHHASTLLAPLVKELSDIPAADVEPVRHGRWINTESYGPHYMSIVQCSYCKRELEGSMKDNFCPNCGAKMDKE